MTKFPIYVLLEDEIPVKIDKKDDIVFATLGNGKPYPPLKAIGEGNKITQEEFNRRAKALAASS